MKSVQKKNKYAENSKPSFNCSKDMLQVFKPRPPIPSSGTIISKKYYPFTYTFKILKKKIYQLNHLFFLGNYSKLFPEYYNNFKKKIYDFDFGMNFSFLENFLHIFYFNKIFYIDFDFKYIKKNLTQKISKSFSFFKILEWWDRPIHCRIKIQFNFYNLNYNINSILNL